VSISGQTKASIERNADWFRKNQANYNQSIQEFDTYKRLRSVLDQELGHTKHLLDIGNGGVFDYDTGNSDQITALDLFLDSIDQSSYPRHITFLQGSALDIPLAEHSVDCVLIVMLLHHLVGSTVEQSRENVRRCIAECKRVLKSGGRLVLAESCVPHWFYTFEKAVFQPAGKIVEHLISHPITLQHPVSEIKADILTHFASCAIRHVPKGRYVLQFGMKVPSWVTPVEAHVFVAQ
jgi:ubiquinone/menaquinone biosynthesis C-methylase UbiE